MSIPSSTWLMPSFNKNKTVHWVFTLAKTHLITYNNTYRKNTVHLLPPLYTTNTYKEHFMAQREAVIVAAVRTAVGRRNGRLKDWHPVDLMAEVLSALVQRTGVDPASVE